MQNKVSIRQAAANWIIPGVLVFVAWAVFYFPLISGSKIPGFRDGSHFYLPLYAWIASEIDQGTIPLWNPNENLGHDVASEPSSALFYPPKIIFHIPVGTYTYRYGIYIALHGLLVILNTIVAARVLGCSLISATVAGISFGLSGPVVFGSMNVIFLVGCAWLPFAIGLLWSIYKSPSIFRSVLLALTIAMMILGGDPQMACHVVFVGILLLMSQPRSLFLACTSFLNRKQSLIRKRNRLFIYSVCCCFSILLAACLAAVQVLPAYSKSSESKRSYYARPHNIYQIHEYLGRDDANEDEIKAGFFGVPEAGSHQQTVYEFSQPPWTIAECIWPNISGRAFPIQQRWMDGLVGADRVWNPSLYFGIATVIFVFARSRKSLRLRFSWLSATGMFFLLGSFGWYGLGWLIKEILGERAPEQLGSHVGGLYWMLSTCVPLYSGFRYPAKLFAVAVLCFCLLGSLKLDSKQPAKSFSPICRVLLIGNWLILIGVLIAYFLGLRLNETFDAPNLFGPLDQRSLYPTLTFGLVHATIVVTAVYIACQLSCRFRWSASLFRCVVATVVVLDLLTANRWLMPTTDFANTASPQWLDAAQSEPAIPSGLKKRTYRVDSQIWQPLRWYRESDRNRLNQVQQWEYETVSARTGLLHGFDSCNSFTTLELIEDEFLDLAFRENFRTGPLIDGKPIQWYRMLGVQYVILPDTHNRPSVPKVLTDDFVLPPNTELIYRGDSYAVWRINQTGDRAFVCETPVYFHPEKSKDPTDQFHNYQVLIDKLKKDPLFNRFGTGNPQFTSTPDFENKSESNASVKSASPSGVFIDVRLNKQGSLVFAYRYSPSLTARYQLIGQSDWVDADISRVYGILGAIDLKPGQYKVLVTYDNKWLNAGAWISSITVILLVIAGVFKSLWRISNRRKR